MSFFKFVKLNDEIETRIYCQDVGAVRVDCKPRDMFQMIKKGANEIE
jgi:hypothetical protein